MTSTKSQTNSNNQNSKFQTDVGHLVIGIWNLFGFWDLRFGIWLRILFFALLFSITIPIPCLSQTPIKVGALIPFTGRWEDSGRECARGVLDAGKWINQRGGIYGTKLEISLIEDTYQPAEFIAAFRKLTEADRILLLYIYSLETGRALLPHIHFNRIPTFISSFTSDLANPGKYPYAFSITPTPLDLSKIAMNFISERSDVKMRKPKVVFVGSADHHGKHFLEDVKGYAKTLGIDIGTDFLISDPSSPKSISAALEAMKSYNPDFAYVSLSSKEASFLLQEAKGMGFQTKWICSMRAFDENLSSFEGIMGVQPISPFGEDIPGMVDIMEAHRRWHPHDSHTLSYVEGWATVQVIAEAMGRALPEYMLSRERVKGVLEGFKEYVTGGLVPPLTITPKDHRPSVESRIFIVKEGKLSRYSSFISISR
jgi:branched-chain amino acid transport system substrate-binding protein